MPIFEYICQECGESFEKLILFSAASAQATCPHCSSNQTKKKISVFSSSKQNTAGNNSSCGSSSSPFR